MKKIILFLIVFAGAMNLCAQSVMGIDFGSSYETVKSKLQERVGEFHFIESSGKLECLSGIALGGFDFDYADFEFQYGNGSSYFNYAYFEKRYTLDAVRIAIKDRDFLFSLLKDKYVSEFVDNYTNEDGYKCYRFGLNPKDKESVLGQIILEKAEGKDGKKRLYLCLRYGPIYYIDKASDF
jgi:hypothetical protein